MIRDALKKTKKASQVCQKRLALRGNFSLDYLLAIPASMHYMKSLADSDPREDKNFTELTVFSVSATARSGFLLLVEEKISTTTLLTNYTNTVTSFPLLSCRSPIMLSARQQQTR